MSDRCSPSLFIVVRTTSINVGFTISERYNIHYGGVQLFFYIIYWRLLDVDNNRNISDGLRRYFDVGMTTVATCYKLDNEIQTEIAIIYSSKHSLSFYELVQDIFSKQI